MSHRCYKRGASTLTCPSACTNSLHAPPPPPRRLARFRTSCEELWHFPADLSRFRVLLLTGAATDSLESPTKPNAKSDNSMLVVMTRARCRRKLRLRVHSTSYVLPEISDSITRTQARVWGSDKLSGVEQERHRERERAHRACRLVQ